PGGPPGPGLRDRRLAGGGDRHPGALPHRRRRHRRSPRRVRGGARSWDPRRGLGGTARAERPGALGRGSVDVARRRQPPPPPGAAPDPDRRAAPAPPPLTHPPLSPPSPLPTPP